MAVEPIQLGPDVTLYLGDCLDVLPTLDAASVDSIVTDSPYGIAFMGKRWDYDVPSVDVWRECLRVLKPGGHLLAFAGTRTQHRMAVNIEDAGFEIRDMIAWVYGQGFPKSLDVSKAIDAAAGAEREVVGSRKLAGKARVLAGSGFGGSYEDCRGTPKAYKEQCDITAPATDAARQWDGWGTALKPAMEPITVARKPLIGTVAANVLEHGTGAINVDACRVALQDGDDRAILAARSGGKRGFPKDGYVGGVIGGGSPPGWDCSKGRHPANLIHDGSDEVLAESTHGDFGSAARFFYTAKASQRDRNEGCGGRPLVEAGSLTGRADGPLHPIPCNRNTHPTVKPTDLMQYLCRLVTQPGGVVLDPFMGSGSTGKAAMKEGFKFIGIERDADSVDIARRRIRHVIKQQRVLRENRPLGFFPP